MEENQLKRISGSYFSYYKSKQIQGLSVVKIYKLKAFDKNGKAIKSGLYDPAMGVSPTSKYSMYITINTLYF